MTDPAERFCIAFEGARRVAEGDLQDVAREVRLRLAVSTEPVLMFDAATSEQLDVDLRGPDPNRLVNASADTVGSRRPGRPKLGVVAREVTLLPRHWDWLGAQPGGASVTLRRLVEDARRAGAQKGVIRAAQESAYRFMSVMAGDLPGFEEAARALFRKDQPGFEAQIAAWPTDVRDHAARLAAEALRASPAPD